MTEGARTAPLGKYANHFEVGSNAFEIVLDFGQWYEGGAPELHTRIVTSPRYALILMKVLENALKDYETRFGALRHE
jgi:hypothetical protein